VIRQGHLEAGIRDVLDSRRVMRQSLIAPDEAHGAVPQGLEAVGQMYATLHRGMLVAAGMAVFATAVAIAALVLTILR
jgi:hypothetical protein